MLNKFRTGKTVYSGGSFAPHRGPVSGQGQMGYVRRQVRQRNAPFKGVSRFGNDGQSDTRSGRAKAALARQAVKGGQQGIGRPVHTAINGGGGGASPAKQPFNNTGRPVVGANGRPAPAQGPNTNLQVDISPDGTLNLPYDSEWSSNTLDMLNDYNAQLLEMQGSQQAQAADYAMQQQQLGTDYEKQRLNTLNRNAGAGTTFTSAYGTGLTGDARAYTNDMNALNTGNTQFSQQQAAQRAMLQGNFNQQLQRDALALAEKNAEVAGTLGYGTARPLVTPDRKPKKKPKKRQLNAVAAHRRNRRKK